MSEFCGFYDAYIGISIIKFQLASTSNASCVIKEIDIQRLLVHQNVKQKKKIVYRRSMFFLVDVHDMRTNWPLNPSSWKSFLSFEKAKKSL